MAEEAKKEEKARFTEAEIQTLAEMDYEEQKRWYGDSEELQKLRNTIEALETDLKSTKGLKRFLTPGVLINDRLILGAQTERYRLGVFLRAFDEKGQVFVELNVEEADRLRRLLPEAIKCAKNQKNLLRLNELLKEKTSRRY